MSDELKISMEDFDCCAPEPPPRDAAPEPVRDRPDAQDVADAKANGCHFDLGQDDGWLDLSINGKSKRVDIMRCQGDLWELLNKNPDKTPQAGCRAAQEVLKEYGFGEISTFIAHDFLTRFNPLLVKLAEDLKAGRAKTPRQAAE